MAETSERERVVTGLASASYTPARKDLGVVVALIGGDDEKLAAAATRALLRASPADALAALAAAERAPAIASAIGQLARMHAATPAAEAAVERLVGMLETDRAGRAAVMALGKVGGEAARAALVDYAGKDLPADHRRAVVEALGKVGGAQEVIAKVSEAAGDDRELARRRDRALLMAERDRGRETPSTVRPNVEPPEPIAIAVRCRAGIEGLLGDELRAAGMEPRDTERGLVRVLTRAALGRFHAARTWISLGIERPIAGTGELPDRIAATLTAPAVRALLAKLTDGPIRWRLDFAGGGHRRAVVWRTAQLVRAAAPELVNDPTATTWDVVVAADDASLELRPRRLEDPRFAWRVADVSAASHPTIAAAIARVAGAAADDVVWDPFCGSGSELVERGLLGPYARLLGSDLDARALDAARANLTAAGLRFELFLADALAHDPGRVSLILSNPPLGRRLRGDPAPLLSAFVRRAATLLRPGGRLVWITPATERTSRAATHAGLTLHSRLTVDLGGYDAHLERWHR